MSRVHFTETVFAQSIHWHNLLNCGFDFRIWGTYQKLFSPNPKRDGLKTQVKSFICGFVPLKLNSLKGKQEEISDFQVSLFFLKQVLDQILEDLNTSECNRQFWIIFFLWRLVKTSEIDRCQNVACGSYHSDARAIDVKFFYGLDLNSNQSFSTVYNQVFLTSRWKV